MTKQSRSCVWETRVWVAAGALVFSALMTGGAWAQGSASAPATDTFANNSSPSTVYPDAYSSSCDKKNGTSLARDSPDPAVCFDVPKGQNGGCPIGGMGSTFAGTTGNICHYCQPRPQGNVIVVPNEGNGAAYAAYQQGYVCSANPGDSCYLTCYGTKKFTPPSSTNLKPGSGNSETPPSGNGGPPPIKNENARSPLVGHLIFDTPDACHPAGVEQYNVCDYPNLPRPAGCTCSTNPKPQPVAKTEPAPKLMAQKPAPGSPQMKCGAVSTDTALWFGSEKLGILDADLAEARAAVAQAQKYTDQNKWNATTLAISQRLFGNATPQTQTLMRQSVNNVLKVLNGISSAKTSIFPAATDESALSDPPPEKCAAYVRPKAGNPVEIFVCDTFWSQLPKGPESQAMILVHEVSHLPNGANTLDYAYGQSGCDALITFATPLGQSVAPITQWKYPIINKPVTGGLTEKIPGPYTPSSPMENADTFKYFVYYVANQTVPK
ncbi:MAG: M35 family metallo-endopeptidase [Terracidiphilus sp.]